MSIVILVGDQQTKPAAKEPTNPKEIKDANPKDPKDKVSFFSNCLQNLILPRKDYYLHRPMTKENLSLDDNDDVKSKQPAVSLLLRKL